MTPKLSKNQISVGQLHEYTPKQVLNPSSTQNKTSKAPKSKKMTPKLIKNQMSELREIKKSKVVQLHE